MTYRVKEERLNHVRTQSNNRPIADTITFLNFTFADHAI